MNPRIREAEAAGNLAEARRLYEVILFENPRDIGANLGLGIIAAKTQALPEAIGRLQTVLELDPVRFEALIWLAPLLRQTGDVSTAIELCRVATTVRPEDPSGHSILGLCLMSQGRPELAESAFERAVELAPGEALLRHQLGECLQLLGRNAEAEAAFRTAIRLAPLELASYVVLAQLLLSLGNREAAAGLYRQAYEIEPDTNRGLSSLAKALIEEGQTEDAIRVLRQILASAPGAAPIHLLLGNALRNAGRFAEAVTSLNQAIELRPTLARAYFSLTYSRKTLPSDIPFVDRIKALLGGRLNLDDRAYLEYTVGKSMDDLGDFASAIGHFDEANRIMRRLARQPFDRGAHEAAFDVAIRLTPQLEPTRVPTGRPVLIVGMIRSGTTLLEQILSSHPSVTGAGELTYWLDHASDCLDPLSGGLDFPGIGRAGDGYLKLLESFGPKVVVDKMPLNYQYLGLIYLACPGIRILHCRRDPLDNCLSAYLTPYPAPVPYAHDRSDLAFYYREYQRLMAHWERVLPSSQMLGVDYEGLILDRENTTQKVLDFLDLEWDPACLLPESNRRTVETPSSWQVRQPVYRTSIGRWRNYEPWLGELAPLNRESDL